MSESYKKLVKTLQTIFEMDKADLDFGIYRIMNQKRDDINDFLENDLLSQVKKSFEDYNSEGRGDLQQELEMAIEQAKKFGALDPEMTDPVIEIRRRIDSSVDAVALENDVFSKLHTFFSRYYDKGDFISKRRYKADTYSIPYEGEEVKLYWANHDQYYIKSSEHLRDYAFTVEDDKKSVRIKLVKADAEKDNIKEKSGEERRFVLDKEYPLSEENGELLIHFNFLPIGKKKQEKLNEEAVKAVFEQTGFDDWLAILSQLASTDKNPKRTLLERHLNEYTARNTFDYFIHKDLASFLNRELDFFIKNEVLFLDDIDEASFSLTEQQLRKIKIIRSIAKKIIRMLAQLEDFQKKLWLKKKFVIKTDYCITLDKIDDSHYKEILNCKDQLKEWKEYFDVDIADIEDLVNEKYLVLDTKFFDDQFKYGILSKFDNIDNELDGILINSENFGALSLINTTYKEKVKTIYVDPPYNATSSEILYMNNYKHSSWISFIDNRIAASKSFLKKDRGVFILAIDENEQENVGKLFDLHFNDYQKTCVSVIHNPGGIQGNNFSYSNEFAYFLYPNKRDMIKKVKRDNPNIESLRDWGGEESKRTTAKNCFYPIVVNKDNIIIKYGNVCDDNFHPESPNIIDKDGNIEIYPIDNNGIERKWRYARHTVEGIHDQLHCHITDGVRSIKNEKSFFRLKTVWDDKKYNANAYGSKILNNILPKNPFTFPKSLYTVEDSIFATSDDNSYILDFFSGSGTTAHAVIDLNRNHQSSERKYILIEMGDYFDSVTKPRTKKVIYSSSYVDGRPLEKDGVSQMFKYFNMESYEDSLNNLELSPNKSNQDLLSNNQNLKEDYMLGYWLNVETADSSSLLNIDQFEDPFNYKLNIGTGSVGATKATIVDLMETFNYLIGLKIKTIDVLKGFKVVIGENPQDETVLIVWRNIKEENNDALEEFLDKQGYNPRDSEFDHIYVNGDHTLEDPRSIVKMIEIEFKRLMFDVEDV